MATASQIAEIRLISGDNITGKEIVSDDIISDWYDDSTSICGTAYKVARARLAVATQTVGAVGETLSNNPKVNAIVELLNQIKADCSDAYEAPKLSVINLGIDEETDLVDIE